MEPSFNSMWSKALAFGLWLLVLSCGSREPAAAPVVSASRPRAIAGEPAKSSAVPARGAARSPEKVATKHQKRANRKGRPAPAEKALPELLDHQTALLRQLGGSWGAQPDRDQQATFPLLDSGNWRRVRFRGVPHFAGFSYGPDHALVTSAFVVKTKGKPTSRRCMAMFESEAIREYENLGGRRSAIVERRTKWHGQDLLVHAGDGDINVLFSNYRFSVAWAAYPAYQDGCIIYGTVVLWGDHPGLAQKVRDRWAKEGFQRYVALTKAVPDRRAR
jgi:hypothetical protein